MSSRTLFISFFILTAAMLVLVFKHYLKDMELKKLIKLALVAAIYAALTFISAPLSYGMIQFRISELMVILAFIDPLYVPGLLLGCIIANFASPLGMVDVFIGSFATLVSLYLVTKSKNLFTACLCPLVNGPIVGAELYFLINAPLLASIFYVALGEFVVVTLVGYPLYRLLLNNKKVVTMLKL